jgi:hypothetical protein
MLRTVKLYGYMGDSPGKNLCQRITLHLYQENDCQIDVQIVDFSTLAPVDVLPDLDSFAWKLYNREDSSEAFVLTYPEDDEVTVDGHVISIRLHDTAVSELAGFYDMECYMVISGFKLTLFHGSAFFVVTNM